ncbi:GTPase [Pseudomonas saudiphocaensis]|uniref:GTPase n=1 Tax=Pseudomonas saudiphocaensis TaxID=1499686 RepID=UPI00187D4588|nr:GTPase [Pseudomonas saudiphocaensis]MBE7926114.1 50S ribosome-binding GTPase [Pseudomonas saudiphocaensis]
MLPFIIAGIVVAGAATATATYYKKKRGPFPESPSQGPHSDPKPLGDFAVWGQPDTGKTTFISCLRGTVPPTEKKEQTTSIRRYSKFEISNRDGQTYQVTQLCDIPGGDDRLQNWLTEIESRKHIFYIVSLAKFDDSQYLRHVKSDIKHTVERLKGIKDSKRIHIIGAHLDNSKWKSFEPARVREVILQDDAIREIRENLGEGVGYFYAANLLDPSSATQLIEDIINDCGA